MVKMSSTEFVHIFSDIWNSTDRRFSFVLGAGASKSSGIRTGGELADVWLQEIKERKKGEEVEYAKFIQDNEIDINNVGGSYSQIYQQRFCFDFDSGFENINKELESARPGYGYSVLAQILAEKQHNIVITTNFDNLTEEALYTYTSTRPLVCGHESLAIFAKPSQNRPLIVKIHRDRFMSPQSRPEEINDINKAWIEALNQIFSVSIPVFIGYGGNDGSMMGYLEEVNHFGNIFWCERKGVNISDRVKAFLDKHNGKLVEIEGFDELMFLLQAQLELPLLHESIEDIAKGRANNYRDTFESIRKRQSASQDREVQVAAKKIVNDAGEGWWMWELKASMASSPVDAERIYRNGLEIFPNSAELLGNYAFFLQDVVHDYPKAESFYVRALSVDPRNAANLGNYALFLHRILKDYISAQKYYKEALAIDGNASVNNGNYGLFLYEVLKEYDEAEKYYLKALKINPNSVSVLANYASFLFHARNDYGKADEYFNKALSLDANNSILTGNYANFLNETGKDTQQADKYYKVSISLDPRDPILVSNYAIFLFEKKKDYDNAEKYFKQTFSMSPELVNNIAAYSMFLKTAKKNMLEAEKYARKAVEMSPDHENYNCNYAGLLLIMGRVFEADRYLNIASQKAQRKEVQSEILFYKYAHYSDHRHKAFEQLIELLCLGVRSLGFDLQDNVDRAMQDGHPDTVMLQRLADILTKDAPIGDLCQKKDDK